MAAEGIGDIGKLANEVIAEIQGELKGRSDTDKLNTAISSHVQITGGLVSKVEVFDPRSDATEICFLTQDPNKLGEVFLTTLAAQNQPLKDPRGYLKTQIYAMLGKAGFEGLGEEAHGSGSGIPGDTMARYHGGWWSSAY